MEILAELTLLIKNYGHQKYYNTSLEGLCIIKIIDYCITFDNYDIIDSVYCNRTSSILLSYRTVKELCNQLKVPYLFEKFLCIYATKLTEILHSLTEENQEFYGICYKCSKGVIIDNDVNGFYIGICKNDHKIIWTDGYVDDINCTTCQNCINKHTILKLPNNSKAIPGKLSREIIITNKQDYNYQCFCKGIRRNTCYPINLPLGKCYYILDGTKQHKYVSCCYHIKDSTNDNQYLKYVYLIYQNSNLTKKEIEKIKIIMTNTHHI